MKFVSGFETNMKSRFNQIRRFSSSFGWSQPQEAAHVFSREGYLPPRPLTCETNLQTLHDAILQDTGGEDLPQQFSNSHFRIPEVWKLATNPALISLMQNIFGQNLAIFSTTIFAKYPGTAWVGYHQDVQYWNITPSEAATVWIALVPSTQDNGCLKVVPKTHTQELEHRFSDDETNVLMARQYVPDEVLEQYPEPIYLDMDAGSFSVHHGRIVHGSEPNRCITPRLGLTVQFIEANTQLGPFEYDPEQNQEWRYPVVVSGTGNTGFFFDHMFEFDHRKVQREAHREFHKY